MGFKDDIWAADLAEMGVLSPKIRNVKYLLCVIDFVTNYAWFKHLKAKIYKKMTSSDSKSYLSCLNKLVDQYNNSYRDSINKEPINADYFALTEKTETNPKAHRFKVNHRVRITKY